MLSRLLLLLLQQPRGCRSCLGTLIVAAHDATGGTEECQVGGGADDWTKINRSSYFQLGSVRFVWDVRGKYVDGKTWVGVSKHVL